MTHYTREENLLRLIFFHDQQIMLVGYLQSYIQRTLMVSFLSHLQCARTNTASLILEYFRL